jgi:hypothetical protein
MQLSEAKCRRSPRGDHVASGRNQPARNAAHVLGRLLRVYEDIPNAKAAMARLRAPDGDQEEPWESD